MTCRAFMDYSRPSHSQLVPELLRPQATVPEPQTPLHNAHALGVSRYGHLFALEVQHYLEERSLIEWGCHNVSQALTRPPAPGVQRVWLFADGSSGESGHAAAITAFLPDDTTRVLCLSSPHPSSLGSEFWGAIAAIRWIHREFSQYDVCVLINNDQGCPPSRNARPLSPAPFRDDTRTIAVHSALRLIINALRVPWIKGHAKFVGNKPATIFPKGHLTA